MCRSVHNFMDLFKAVCGVICEASFYRPAVSVGSTLATIRHWRAKVRWRVLSPDYQVSHFILSSFSLATILFYLFFYTLQHGWPHLYISISLFLSLFLSLPLSISMTIKKDSVSFEFYLKIAMGNTRSGCKNNKKILSLGGELFNSEGGEEEEEISEKVSAWDKEGKRLLAWLKRRYFIKGYWLNNWLTGFFFKMRSSYLLSPKKGCHLEDRLFLS